ncbi:FtsX-like permease family protein [Nocardia sp. CNY236]|uniref:FtsX-like permease family protein n=1 Tax=Nocardia sp. CNY236 TaxID=1169152 RepID=UPI0003F91E37|nr:ABC transporter permease [Nocardia sp. CNY236]
MTGSLWDRLRLFNLGELLVHRARTLLSLLVIAVSAGLLVAVLSISGSVSGSVNQLSRGLGGNAQLEVTGFTDAGFDQRELPRIAATEGVAAAVPMLRAEMGNTADRVLLVGAGANIGALGSELTAPMTSAIGKLLSVPNGVLVGDALGHAEGDTVTVGKATVTVAEVLDAKTSRKLNGGHLIAAPLGLAQRIADRPGRLDSVEIIPADGVDIDQLRTALTAAVGDRAVVADPSLRSAQANGPVQSVLAFTIMSAVTALMVSAFLIYNVMSMTITQRRPMLSVLRALGGKRRPMVRDLLIEAAMLGLAGGALGCALGVAMGRVAIDFVPTSIVAMIEARIEYMVPVYVIPLVIAICVAVSVFAASLAVRQIYQVHPIEALSPIDAVHAATSPPLLRWFAGALGIGLLVLSVPIARSDLGSVSLSALSMVFLGSIAVCFAFTGPITRAASSITRWFRAPGALGATTLERAPRRAWATAMTVMIVVTAITGTHGIRGDLIEAGEETFGHLDNFDAYVSANPMTQFPTGPLLPADLKQTLATVPGVADVVPAQMAFSTLGSGRILLEGYLPENRIATMSMVSDDAAAQMFAGKGVVISRGVANSLGVGAGADLTLPTATGPHTVRVLEVIPYLTAIADVVMMDLNLMRTWLERPGETVVGITFASDADPTAVRAAIREAIPPSMNIDSGDEAVANSFAAVEQAWQLSQSILWIVVLVGAIALLNMLMLSVLERRRELGVLRAMGTGRRFLTRSVLAEAAGIGLVGAILGLAFGAVLQFVGETPVAAALTVDATYRLSPMLLAYGLLALTLVLLGSLPPAIRVARMPVVEALAVD